MKRSRAIESINMSEKYKVGKYGLAIPILFLYRLQACFFVYQSMELRYDNS